VVLALLLYRFWVLPTAGPLAIYDLGALDPTTHTQYEIDVDEIHRFWPIHIVPPSRFAHDGPMMIDAWLAAEHNARSVATVAASLTIIAYAGFRHWKMRSV
jgi:hypothetical protein